MYYLNYAWNKAIGTIFYNIEDTCSYSYPLVPRYKYQLEQADGDAHESAKHSAGHADQSDQPKTTISMGNCFLNVLGSFTSQGKWGCLSSINPIICDY